MDNELVPGAIARFDDRVLLIESVTVHIVGQVIERRPPTFEKVNPTYVGINGDINDPQFRSPRLVVLASAEETTV